MRAITKLSCPEVLQDNADAWLSAWLADKSSVHKRAKYRHPDIKRRLKEETANKCVYCESILGVTAPGQTEHIVPSSKRERLHFDWYNLTRACAECNRRKNDYYVAGDEFLNPYLDAIDDSLTHCGPLVFWENEGGRAEITVRTLGLNGDRAELVLRKSQFLNELQLLYDRMTSADAALRPVLLRALFDKASTQGEYSACALAFIRSKGLEPV